MQLNSCLDKNMFPSVNFRFDQVHEMQAVVIHDKLMLILVKDTFLLTGFIKIKVHGHE